MQSTAKEWNVTGRKLFEKSLFAQAASCFEKAGRDIERDIAVAYQKREDARGISNARARREMFKDAATAFQSCAIRSEGVRNLRQRAAECFVNCEDFPSAATNFEAACDYTEAAIQYNKAHLFNDVVRLIRPRDGLNSLVADDIKTRLLDTVRIRYLRAHDFECVSRFEFRTCERID